MNHARQAAEAIFTKYPALNALREKPEPKPEHIRSCLMELVHAMCRDQQAATREQSDTELQRLLDWLMEGATKDPASAFTEGVARQCADMVHYRIGVCVCAEQERLHAALQVARAALASCYQVTEWPANGSSDQDKAIDAIDAALAHAEAGNTKGETNATKS